MQRIGWFPPLGVGISAPIPFALSYPTCFIERKGNKHFKIVECSSTYLGCKIELLGCCRVKYSTLALMTAKCWGYHLEQLHQFHFWHPNIIVFVCPRTLITFNPIITWWFILGNLMNSRISLLTVEQKTRHLLVFQNKALHL